MSGSPQSAQRVTSAKELKSSEKATQEAATANSEVKIRKVSNTTFRNELSSSKDQLWTYPELNNISDSSYEQQFQLTSIHGQIANETSEWRPLDKSEIGSVSYFLFFLGWPRSCHSIIGSMLDAHPNVIVAHEYRLFQTLSKTKEFYYSRRRLFNELYKNSYINARSGWRASNHTQKGYTLNMDSSWQGRFTKLRVIGDKCGGDVTGMYKKSKTKFKVLYRTLRANVKVPIKVLQVIRNPLDMIATVTLYRGAGFQEVKVNATVTQKYTNFPLLKKAATYILDSSIAILEMVSHVQLSPLQVYCEDLISHPAETISNICRFLDLECSREYLQMCAEKTFRNVSASRHLVEWDPKTFLSLISKIKTFPFFHRYSDDLDL